MARTTGVGWIVLVCLTSGCLVSELGAAEPSGDDLPAAPGFVRHVIPVFSRLGCNSGGCHGKVKGENGFRLSLFGVDPTADHASLTREYAGRRINRAQLDASLLLAKPLGEVAHRGGALLAAGGREHRLLRRWLEQGAQLNDGAAAPLAKLLVTPAEQVAAPGKPYPLRVVAAFEDGVQEDVTRWCSFQPVNKLVLSVDSEGVVTPLAAGDSAVVVRYGSEPTIAQLLVPGPETAVPDEPPLTFVDEHVNRKLKSLRVPPAARCDDATFLRRVSLDLIGTLPQPAEVRAFLADGAADKRAKKVDELLQRPEYAVFWATWFSDVLRPNGFNPNYFKSARAEERRFHEWLRARMAENTPYDELAERILTATSREGRNEQQWVEEATRLSDEDARRTPELKAYSERKTLDLYWLRDNSGGVRSAVQVAHAFLGLRMECAQCHRHPHDVWKQDDLLSFANFFTRLQGPGERKLSAEAQQLVKNLDGEGKKLSEEAKKLGEGAKKAEDAARTAKTELDPLERKLAELAARAEAKTKEAQTLREQAAQRKKQAADTGDAGEKKQHEEAAAGLEKQALPLEAEAEKSAREAKELREGKHREATEKLARLTQEAEKAKQEAGERSAQAKGKEYLKARLVNTEVTALIGEAFVNRPASVSSPLGTQKSEKFRLLGETESIDVPKDKDPREYVAAWLRRADNPFFARALVNRVWAHYFERGLINPPDQLSPLSPASHPELLEELARRFVEQKFDLRWLHRTLLGSAAWQRSSVPSEAGRHDRSSFAHYYLRRIPAEALIDAVNQVTGSQETFPADLHLPPGARVMQVAGAARGAEGGAKEAEVEYALKIFGRPTRDTAVQCDCERDPGTTVVQALYLANHPRMRDKIYRTDNRVAEIVSSQAEPKARIEELYLAALTRLPEADELQACLEYVGPREHAVAAYQDVLWSLLNTREFVLNH